MRECCRSIFTFIRLILLMIPHTIYMEMVFSMILCILIYGIPVTIKNMRIIMGGINNFFGVGLLFY